jgi:hypothetical protein
MNVLLTTTGKRYCVPKGRAVGKSTDVVWIDEAADLDNVGEWLVQQKERYQEHYREKALSPNLMTGIDIAISDEVTAEPTYDDYRAGGFGAQTPSDSKHLNNLKKKKAWSRSERKHLPPWMRR